jgi:hypothetical protein
MSVFNSEKRNQPMNFLIGYLVGKKRFILAAVQFLAIQSVISRKRPKLIWIGDSHSRYMSGSGQSPKRYEITKSHDLVIWLGPRLLYSIAKNGFRLNALDKALLRKVGKNNTCVFVFGEIDCRVHLAHKSRYEDQEQLASISREFKNHIRTIADGFNFRSCIVLTPVPPSNFGVKDPKFPRVGSLNERVLATKALTKSLVRLEDQSFAILDLSSILASENGALNPDYSEDGVHVNSVGASAVRDSLRVGQSTNG